MITWIYFPSSHADIVAVGRFTSFFFFRQAALHITWQSTGLPGTVRFWQRYQKAPHCDFMVPSKSEPLMIVPREEHESEKCWIDVPKSKRSKHHSRRTCKKHKWVIDSLNPTVWEDISRDMLGFWSIKCKSNYTG